MNTPEQSEYIPQVLFWKLYLGACDSEKGSNIQFDHWAEL